MLAPPIGVKLDVLQLTHMETIGIRQLQQHASAAVRRVEQGEKLGVTDRGRLVAVLVPPSAAGGAAALIAAGRVSEATVDPRELPPPVKLEGPSIQETLDELREDRV